MEGNGGVAAVDRALAILAALGRTRKATSLAELAKETGLYRSTILRLIASLSRAGYVQRLDSGLYQLGPTVLQLGQVYQETFRLGDVLGRELRDLAERTGESVSLFVRQGDVRICLYRVDSPRPVREHVRVGEALPLDRGAAGRILLAFTEPAAPRFDDLRRRMVTWSKGERASGASAVACPLFGPDGGIVGAMTVSGLASDFDAARAVELGDLLFGSVVRLTRRLGGDPAGLERAYEAFREGRAFADW